MNSKYGRTLAEQWRSYEKQVLPPAAGAVQRQETRRAFYAGAQSAFLVLVHGVSPGSNVTENDEALMIALDAEFRQFADDMKAGLA